MLLWHRQTAPLRMMMVLSRLMVIETTVIWDVRILIQSEHKEIPRGLKVWTIDERFGDRKPAVPDTLSYMYMNSNLTYGKRGEYNTLGNLGSPRQNRIFIDRPATSEFFFLDPYDMFYRTAKQLSVYLNPFANHGSLL